MKCTFIIYSVTLLWFSNDINCIGVKERSSNIEPLAVNYGIICNGELTSKETDICKSFSHDKTQLEIASGQTINGKLDKITKRDTLQEYKAKLNKNIKLPKKMKLLTTKKPLKKLKIKAKSAVVPHGKPSFQKDLEARIKELRARMSVKPLLKARASFKDEEKVNLIEKLKSKQEELKEKLKLYPAKSTDSINRQRNRFDLHAPKVGSVRKADDPKLVEKVEPTMSATTEKSKVSHVPVIVLMPTTTDPPQPEPLKETIGKNSAALEKIKEKQKEAVTKIKDKISLSKIKPKEANHLK